MSLDSLPLIISIIGLLAVVYIAGRWRSIDQTVEELQKCAANNSERISELEAANKSLDKSARHDRSHRDMLELAEAILTQVALEEKDEHFAAERRAFIKRILSETVNPKNGGKSK